jgi:hypothetical protein
MGLGVATLGAAIVVSLAAGVVTVACGGPTPKRTDQVAASGVEAPAPKPTTPTTKPAPVDPVVGDKIEVGRGGSLAVTAIEQDVNAGRLFSAPIGKDYFAAEVRACAGPTETELSFEPEYWVAELDSGQALVPGLGVKKPDLRGGVISAGKCMSGWITWVVPEKAKAASVVYNGSTRYQWRIVEPTPKSSTTSTTVKRATTASTAKPTTATTAKATTVEPTTATTVRATTPTTSAKPAVVKPKG